MTHPYSPTGAPSLSYVRSTATHAFLDAAARCATRDLARQDSLARELSDLARWEGEGGALRPSVLHSLQSPVVRSMRFAMSARPAYDSQAQTDIAAMVAAARGKPSSPFAADRNSGPPPRRGSRQNAPARPMNTHRGGRSR